MNVHSNRVLPFTAIILGFFMALLDSTIVNVALPEITRHYGGDVGQISWIMNGYNLAFAVFILTASRLADQFGRKKLFLIGLVLFTATSFLAGVAPNVETLIALRVVQGLAGAIIVPVTVPMATRLFPKEMHGTIIGIWGAISGLAAASGPALGGILTEKLSWQWIFFVNVPLGVLSLLLTIFLIKESYDPTSGKKIDYAGTLTITAAMFLFTYGLIKAKDFGWDSPAELLLMAGGCIFTVLFLLAEWRGREPMLPLSLLKIKPFSASALTLLVVGAGLMNISFLTSFYLTRVLAMTELKAGLILSVVALGSMVASLAAGPLSNKYGARWFAVCGIVFLIGASYWLGGLHANSTTGEVIPRLALAGIGIGLTMAPLMASTIRHVPEEKVGISSGIVNMTKALGCVLGVAVIVTVLQNQMEDRLADSKQAAIQAVDTNQVLLPELKGQIIHFLETMNPNQAFPPDEAQLEQIRAALAEQSKERAAKLPEAQRKAAEAALARQTEEVQRILPPITNDYREAAAKAFGGTFKFSSWLLIVGIPLAYLSDRSRKRQPVSNAAALRPKRADN
ncbi:DHA2 family efflux MFS transporter permease subunit [Paenibacillus sp. CN-4]|uniref:DHA2 family efflux MFS transporter permease subunit n=1 Tax=Paenibacillus nanchangensis TaxID=3348343 RepID=UPI003978E6DB